MNEDDLDAYDRDAELQLFREYRDVVSQFSYVVETERRFYLANEVQQTVRQIGNDFFFELVLTDVWVWDVYRSDRFVKSVKVLTFKDVSVEETGKKELKLPQDLAFGENLGSPQPAGCVSFAQPTTYSPDLLSCAAL